MKIRRLLWSLGSWSLAYLIAAGLLAAIIVPVAVFAQDAAPAVTDAVDWKAVAQGALMGLTGTITFLFLWALKFVRSKIPATVLLYASPVIGLAANFGIEWFAGHQAGLPWYLAMLGGALAPALREFISTPMSKGLTGTVSATKGML